MNQKQALAMQELKPLTTLFGTLTEAQMEIYAEHVEHYQLQVLKKAVKSVSVTWDKRYFPPVAIIVEACKKNLPPVQAAFSKNEKEYPKEAEQIMKSSFGQKALTEGWGHDLYVKTMRTGKTDWTESDAVQFRIALRDGVEQAIMLDKARQPMEQEQRKRFGITMDAALASNLWKLWESIQIKEKWLYSTYFGKTASA